MGGVGSKKKYYSNLNYINFNLGGFKKYNIIDKLNWIDIINYIHILGT